MITPTPDNSQDQIPIRRFPTKLHVICGACGRTGVVEAFIAKPPKLRCRKCGSRDAIIVSRDQPSRTWAKRRMGR